MNNTKVVCENFLRPATQLMNTVSVFEYLFNIVTVADPIYFLASKVSTVMGDAPTTTSNISYKGVIIHLYGKLERDSNNTECKRGPFKDNSEVQSLELSRGLSARRDSEQLSDCVSMYHIP